MLINGANIMNKLILLNFLIIALSCNNVFEKKSGLSFQESQQTPLTAQIDFTQVKRQIFSKHCTICHPGYQNYENVKNDIQNILESVEANQMPKNAPALSRELKDILAQWVANGAPKAPNQSEQRRNPTASWDYLSQEVFFPKCSQCHNPQGQASFLDLSTRQSFFENRSYLFDSFNSDAQHSYFVEVITDPAEPMPPKWSEVPPVTKDELNLIIEWINKGLP